MPMSLLSEEPLCRNQQQRKQLRLFSQFESLLKIAALFGSYEIGPYARPACPAIGGGSEVTFKPLVPRSSVKW
ncbi:hypothetical protein J6590_018331 [Homalodisca vitripennis]|nr:hypothetical protein J6590_018331 [Homalodisca vitripennis]